LVPAIRPDTDATARTATATIASDQSTQRLALSGFRFRIGSETISDAPSNRSGSGQLVFAL
jgi:hypothetical protein